MKDYTEDPRFKQAYEKYVVAFTLYRAGLRDYPTAERENLSEVIRSLTGGKEYPE